MNVLVERNVECTLRDGTILRVNLYRPTQEGSYPVLLTRLPYGKDTPYAYSMFDPVAMASNGYLVAIQDCRGRFSSDGQFGGYAQEFEDGYDAVQWAASLPGSNGQVGMFGASYYGFTQWAAAALRPPALKAILPFFTYDDPWNGAAVRQGAFEWGKTAYWYLGSMAPNEWIRQHLAGGVDPAEWRRLFADFDLLGEKGYWQLPLTEFEPLKERELLPGFFAQFEHPEYDDFWKRLSILHRDEGMDVPSLNVGGWYDIFLQGTIDNYMRMKKRGVVTQLTIGPWSHINRSGFVGEINYGFAANAALLDLKEDMTRLHLRWFDSMLKGKSTGIEEDGPVKIFVMGENRWRIHPEWPLPETEFTPFYFHSAGEAKTSVGDGRLSREVPGNERTDDFLYDPADPVPTVGGNLLMAPEFQPGPRDQTTVEERPDVLVYTSDPLLMDMEVTGPVRAVLWVSTSAEDTDFVVRLTDVHPDGRSIPLCDGIVRMSLRDPNVRTTLQPGEVYRVEVDCWATSNVFFRGHRIRVHVTSSCFPRWNRNLNTGQSNEKSARYTVAEQVVYHDSVRPSHIVLPLVPRS
ncbi:CocE/NonD family hydrolase [Alicyclobacillus tolerans]|uniref:CocE/NonD family hydrolase n=1 Tax=Alicyclobacillus tolerans TaxID=90970 RepID=UPI001F01C4CC|nr:CocE/NonD family hydrolase [Alicyclobacillus tolerans]MCF8566486.1 CocE/NonD family hydrolase [Alicyclobacillus tolerans]